MMRRFLLICALWVVAATSGGCGITLLSMLPGSGQYENTVIVTGMLADFGLGYVAAEAMDEEDPGTIGPWVYGPLILMVDFLFFRALQTDLSRQAELDNLRYMQASIDDAIRSSGLDSPARDPFEILPPLTAPPPTPLGCSPPPTLSYSAVLPCSCGTLP
ncbi:MAG: hypothetical protein JW909_04645 [Planctomycetes bacterium]|nr:hypothetical protein [Planctomycetota bacterium]